MTTATGSYSPASHVQRCLSILQKALSPRFRKHTWRQDVRIVISELEKLNGATEADFLAVGGKLMDFLTASRELHTEVAELTTLVSGFQAQNARESLVCVHSYVEERQRRSRNSGQALLDVQESAGRIHRGFSGLEKIAKSFHITAIMARIEAAHLTNSQYDMGDLANEVQACSNGIQSRAEQVLEAAATFDTRIALTLKEVSHCDAIQQKDLPSLLAAIDRDLQLFDAQQREAAGASEHLTTRVTAVSKDLGTIATSIQAHDITRQQVEHVIEALTALLESVPRRAPSPSEAGLLKVQRAQLQSAALSFAQSTGQIDRDLSGIAQQVIEMTTASKAILGGEQTHQESVLGQMQHRLSEVLRTLKESSEADDSALSITSDLEGLTERLRVSVNEVQSIQLNLSRISINGAISANHIGLLGEPLSVVASAMQDLQIECAERSRHAEADLDVIAGTIRTLRDTSSHQQAKVFANRLLEDLNSRMRDLGSAASSSAKTSSSVVKLAAGLSSKLEEARAHSGIGQLFADTLGRCCDSLDAVTEQAEPAWGWKVDPVDEAAPGRYTMEAERNIHDSIMSGNDSPPAAFATEEVENEVEFF